MSVMRFLAGFAVGAALGAVAGVLLAPKSGDETREMLGDMASDLAKKTEATVKDIQKKADNIVSVLPVPVGSTTVAASVGASI